MDNTGFWGTDSPNKSNFRTTSSYIKDDPRGTIYRSSQSLDNRGYYGTDRYASGGYDDMEFLPFCYDQQLSLNPNLPNNYSSYNRGSSSGRDYRKFIRYGPGSYSNERGYAGSISGYDHGKTRGRNETRANEKAHSSWFSGGLFGKNNRSSHKRKHHIHSADVSPNYSIGAAQSRYESDDEETFRNGDWRQGSYRYDTNRYGNDQMRGDYYGRDYISQQNRDQQYASRPGNYQGRGNKEYELSKEWMLYFNPEKTKRNNLSNRYGDQNYYSQDYQSNSDYYDSGFGSRYLTPGKYGYSESAKKILDDYDSGSMGDRYTDYMSDDRRNYNQYNWYDSNRYTNQGGYGTRYNNRYNRDEYNDYEYGSNRTGINSYTDRYGNRQMAEGSSQKAMEEAKRIHKTSDVDLMGYPEKIIYVSLRRVSDLLESANKNDDMRYGGGYGGNQWNSYSRYGNQQINESRSGGVETTPSRYGQNYWETPFGTGKTYASQTWKGNQGYSSPDGYGANNMRYKSTVQSDGDTDSDYSFKRDHSNLPLYRYDGRSGDQYGSQQITSSNIGDVESRPYNRGDSEYISGYHRTDSKFNRSNSNRPTRRKEEYISGYHRTDSKFNKRDSSISGQSSAKNYI